MSLLDDLKTQQARSAGIRGCPVCNVIASEGDEETRTWLIAASGGTIGIKKLSAIFKKNQVTDPETGNPVGRRSIVRHQQEGHSPS